MDDAYPVTPMCTFHRLRAARTQHGLTQEQMAFLLGYSNKSTYCLKEKGERKLTLDEALYLARLFDTSVENLFGQSQLPFFTSGEGGRMPDDLRY